MPDKLDEWRAIRDRGIRTLHMGGSTAKWCTHCNCFTSDDGSHEVFSCPYLALSGAIQQIEELNDRERNRPYD